jgi:hypothetical protein
MILTHSYLLRMQFCYKYRYVRMSFTQFTGATTFHSLIHSYIELLLRFACTRDSVLWIRKTQKVKNIKRAKETKRT